MRLRFWLQFQFSFSRSVMSDSLWPLGPQHIRPPCLSPTPGVYSNSCPSSRWCHPTISSSVVPCSSCLESFLASGSFQMTQLFSSGDLTWLSYTLQIKHVLLCLRLVRKNNKHIKIYELYSWYNGRPHEIKNKSVQVIKKAEVDNLVV